jgi:hypothetical protein
MMNFDAAGRETCVVRELRTNTPLQSLDLMNDQAYLEAAQGLAGRMIREGGESPADRVSYGFLLAAARPPKARELAILMSGFEYNRKLFEDDPAAAAKYLGQREPSARTAEKAAYATAAGVILNMDVTVTKE